MNRMEMADFGQAFAPLALASLLALAGCGGGGGGGGGGSSLSINGTAATGAAIAGATVDAKCATGSGSATTSSSGSFDINISGGASPCVLRVNSGGTLLHSLVPAGSGAATANLNPLSELIVARVNAGDPDALFTAFDAAGQARITPAAASSAQAAVIAALHSALDLTGFNPIAGDASVGGTLDRKLDALAALLAARGVTLADLTSAIEAGSTDAATRLLQPVASSCDGLRSGAVRLVVPPIGKGKLNGVTQFDASTLHYVLPDGSTGALTDNGGCAFSADDGTKVLFAKSGFMAIVTAATDTGPSFLFFGIPEQSIALSELAGTWNYVAYLTTTNPLAFVPSSGNFTLDAAGKATNNLRCVNLDACTDAGPLADLTPAAGGGFTRSSVSGTDAYYVFKNGSGKYTMVSFLTDGAQFGYRVATKQTERKLPATGDVTKLHSLTIDGQGTASAITDSTYTVLSVDASAQSFTRQRQQDARMETFDVNSPRTGLAYRHPGDAPAIIAMQMPGSAATVFTSADSTHNFFGVSIQYP